MIVVKNYALENYNRHTGDRRLREIPQSTITASYFQTESHWGNILITGDEIGYAHIHSPTTFE